MIAYIILAIFLSVMLNNALGLAGLFIALVLFTTIELLIAYFNSGKKNEVHDS